jgi:hypothetical protein
LTSTPGKLRYEARGNTQIFKKEVMLMQVNKKALRELLGILADRATIAGFILILIDRLG